MKMELWSLSEENEKDITHFKVLNRGVATLRVGTKIKGKTVYYTISMQTASEKSMFILEILEEFVFRTQIL